MLCHPYNICTMLIFVFFENKNKKERRQKKNAKEIRRRITKKLKETHAFLTISRTMEWEYVSRMNEALSGWISFLVLTMVRWMIMFFFLLLLLPHICGKNGLKFNQSWNWNRKFIIIITWKILKVLNILPLPYFNAINLCVWFFVFYFGEVQIKWSPKQLKREHISDYKMQSNDHNPLKVHLMQNKVLCRKVNGKTKNWKVESEREGQSKRKI